MLHAVILAGGSGTRLWPLSRAQYPKQFLKLLGAHTLLQQTVLRIGELVPPEQLWVVASKEQEPIVRLQLSSLLDHRANRVHVLVEPLSRNTAAAIGLAAIHIQQHDPHAVMAILPADHWIERQEAFVTLLQRIAGLAQQGMLVTLGIIPDRPEPGYGYIRRGTPITLPQAACSEELKAYAVAQFVEKPDFPTAQQYLSSGQYYWNAGIFLWQASTILEEISAYLPTLHHGLGEIAQRLDSDTALAAVYSQLKSISIDYGILEKSARVVVVPADIGWSDLGDWTAIHRLSPQDERGNTFSANVVDVESEHSFVYGNERIIATIGLKDMVVVDAKDALLICPTNRVQEVKTLAQQLQERGAEAALVAHTVHRPWGTYTVLDEGAGFKVKRLVVNPGAALSLQLHHQRSEHWVIVGGVAQVRNGDVEFVLQVGQSTYIPRETIHRLTNPGAELLEIIEVQTGSYLGEDDIVRFADRYQRVPS